MYTVGELSRGHQNSTGLSGLGAATAQRRSTVAGSLLGTGLVPVATVAHSALRSPKSCLDGFVCRIRGCDKRKQEETFMVHAPTGPNELKPRKQSVLGGKGHQPEGKAPSEDFQI